MNATSTCIQQEASTTVCSYSGVLVDFAQLNYGIAFALALASMIFIIWLFKKS